ncbi:restriction endonuclease subunit S [Providencia huaxiensis]|uniref:restriction endonuclease subunit S n=2 Tax=Providencia huaxiensis TaxID=2027290 RepID=UPI0028108E11|nr:restriction endonuclease subunit S [Providencia rettgeri]ELR5085891.1 restriction endonuclease subunit S [Providencia rettgeri]ELY3855697.1 restriction endonuclease subunit S [Providencia rettgeri]
MKLVKLKDITSKITKGTTPSKSDGGFSSIGVNYIKAESVSYDGRIDESKFAFINEVVHKKLKRSQLQENDILFSMAGAFLGKTGLVMKHHLPANTNQALALIRVKPEIAHPKFIHYYLQQKSVVHFVNNAVSQSAQPNINLQQIGDLDICLLTLAHQQRAVEFLDAIDNKITLNRQINQTLEQTAQTLFKSWFVDFDPVIDNALDSGFFEQDLAFSEELLHRVEMRKAVRRSDNFKLLSEGIRQLFPDAFEECTEPVLGLGGWVPKGWGSSPVGSLIELIGGGTPKTSESSYWGGDIPWFSVVDAPNDSDVFVMDTEKKITELGIQNSSAKILKVGTTIISARGTVGKCALVAKPMAINQSCYGIVGKNGIHDYFTYYLIRHSVSHLQQRSHGSVFSTITRDTFNSFNFIFSGDLIANAFGETISFWFEKIARNNQQNYILQKLRDTLLPKLISGELSLSDIKTDIPEETLI